MSSRWSLSTRFPVNSFHCIHFRFSFPSHFLSSSFSFFPSFSPPSEDDARVRAEGVLCFERHWYERRLRRRAGEPQRARLPALAAAAVDFAPCAAWLNNSHAHAASPQAWHQRAGTIVEELLLREPTAAVVLVSQLTEALCNFYIGQFRMDTDELVWLGGAADSPFSAALAASAAEPLRSADHYTVGQVRRARQLRWVRLHPDAHLAYGGLLGSETTAVWDRRRAAAVIAETAT
jgi:hypothetical protein